jgi:hypothetical protein
MVNCANNFEPSALVVQQTEIYLMSGLIPGPQQPRNDIETYFRPLVKDLKELWYNDGVQVWDEHKREYFGLKTILFVIVSDSPAARNLSKQSKKVGC